MMKKRVSLRTFIIILSICGLAKAGPYNEQGIASYIGPDHKPVLPWDMNGVSNPIFRGWATEVVSYEPTPYNAQRQLWWFDPSMALGPSMSNRAIEDVLNNIVSLGELSAAQIAGGVLPGRITLGFAGPIVNGRGFDFAVFENGQLWGDLYFCELGYVEVSSNGEDFARFPSVSLAPYDSGGPAIPNYRCIDITDIYNLAGKHPNLGEEFTGTPFDLAELADEPNVLNGLVDLNNINYVRIVDIPGSGDFTDDATQQIDPCTWPEWDYYITNHPIYDAWPTYGSDGMDLEAIGVLYPQEYGGDINLDGIVDFEDLEIFAESWLSYFGRDNYLARCDLAEPRDLVVDFRDFAVLAADWGKVEQWR
jgi:hypothetical protein